MSPRTRLILGVISELGLWSCVAGAFLSVFVLVYEGRIEAVLPHLAVVATFWCACIAVRLSIASMPLPDGTIRLLTAVVAGASFLALILCEAAFLVGLSSWGRIPTWSLISAYLPKSHDLLSTLGVHPGAVYLGTTIGVLILFAKLASPSSLVQWTMLIVRALPTRWVVTSIVSLCIAVSIRAYQLAVDPPAYLGEPFSLMLVPNQNAYGKTPRVHADRAAGDMVKRKSYLPNADAKRRNVILFVGDALRADHMSANGYFRNTTPYIDSLLSTGVARTLNPVTSVCAESICGLMAIAQSRYVHQFYENPITMHEVLRMHGYNIRMILGGDHTNFYHLKDSFGAVDEYFDGSMASDYYMNDDQLVVDRVRSMPPWDGKPVFIQFHLMSSHGLGKRHGSFLQFQPFENYYLKGRSESPESWLERARNYYDNGVLQFDSMVGEIIEDLKRKGYLDDAIVIITADHGEMLGEHGTFSHSSAVYQEALHIPFIFVDFGHGLNERVLCVKICSQVDIAPTILHELDVPVPSEWSGHALQESTTREYVFFQQGEQVGLFDIGASRVWKYWLKLSTREEFAFDLSGDEAERKNLIEYLPKDLTNRWRFSVMESGASVGVVN
jgi:glucan phosphoethanolaminetransferase (alkaline phosphatase superfamily)